MSTFMVQEDGSLSRASDTYFDLHRAVRARIILAETRAAADMGLPLSNNSDVGLGLHADALDALGKRSGERGLLEFHGAAQAHLLKMGGDAGARWAEEAPARAARAH